MEKEKRMAGVVKQRNPKEQKKKRKDGPASEKHKFSLADQMDDEKEAPPRNRSSKTRKLQGEEEYVSSGISNKILAEARRQQQEIDDEKDEETGVAAARRAFSDVTANKEIAKEESDEDEDEGGYSDNEYPEEEFEEVTQEDERIMSLFMASDVGPQRTLADMIMERIKEKDAGISSGNAEERNIPGIDEKIVEIYRG